MVGLLEGSGDGMIVGVTDGCGVVIQADKDEEPVIPFV
jgi:hypothetical protein